MNVLLLQLDGKLPNLALMAIARHHRGRGDRVELRQCRSPEVVAPGMYDARPDRVYASSIFTKSVATAHEVRRVFPSAIVGGSGWKLTERLEDHGIDQAKHDYTDYPSFRKSMGFTQRGCRLACEFCGVPVAEPGPVRPVATIWDLWRGDPWPRELLLLDNDFFGQPEWDKRIDELRAGKFKVSFNQGINARMLSDEAAAAIASVNYRNDDMDRPMIYTAWDNKKDERPLMRGLERLKKHGVKPDHVTVYILIGFWPGETDADWLYRQQRLREFGCRPFPMPYDRTDRLQMGFQRWCIRRADLKCSWDEYKAANCRPEKVGLNRLALPLFEEARIAGPLEV
jgi:Radical SAM superfamily